MSSAGISSACRRKRRSEKLNVMRPALPAMMALSVLALFASLTGCRERTPPAPSAAQAVALQRMDARIDAIVEGSHGNWSKVSPADRNYLMNEVGKGNERVATMAFNRRSARMTAYLRWMSRVDAMVKRSGGDWNRLSATDRAYLIEIVSKGDQKAAQRTFQERADRLKGEPHTHR